MPLVRQDGSNPFHKSKYTTLAETWATARDILGKNGLVITHEIRVNADLPGCDDTLVTNLWHAETGDCLSTEHRLLLAKENSPQAYGSAITYARRNSLQLLIAMVSGDEDDDAERAEDTLRHAGKRKPVRPPKPAGTPLRSSDSGNDQNPTTGSTAPNGGKSHDWAIHLRCANEVNTALNLPRWQTINPVRQNVITQRFKEWYGAFDKKELSVEETTAEFWKHVTSALVPLDKSKTENIDGLGKLEGFLRLPKGKALDHFALAIEGQYRPEKEIENDGNK